MAKTLLKEQQNEARDICKQIFNLAMAINPNDTKQDITGGKPTVFVNFSGHVAGIDVRIYSNGWSYVDDECELTAYTIWLDDEWFTVLTDDYEPYPEEKECEQLSKAKAVFSELQKIADKWGVDNV
jgi:hypothetical protein